MQSLSFFALRYKTLETTTIPIKHPAAGRKQEELCDLTLSRKSHVRHEMESNNWRESPTTQRRPSSG